MTDTTYDEHLEAITAEMNKLAEHDSPTRAQEARMDALKAEFTSVARQQILAKLNGGEVRLENGAYGPYGDAGEPIDHVSARRDDARRALDELRSVPDEGKQRLTLAFERAEGAPERPELGTLSRWLLTTSRPAYARAVGKLFRDPTNGHREFSAEELDAYQDAKSLQRAMAIGTDSAGGFLLPTHLDPQILLTNSGAVDPMRQICRTEVISTDTWNGISSAGVTASWDAEAAEVSDDSPTLAQPTVPVHKGAAFIAASIEAAMDTNIGDQVQRLFIDAKARLEAAAFATGTGSGQPTGIVTALTGTSSVVTSAATDAYARADILGLQEAVPARWRPRSRFMMALEILNDTREFAKLSAGTDLSLVDDSTSPPKVRGWSVVENSAMDGTINATQDNYLIIAGDFSNYLIVDRIGTTVEFIPHLFATGNNRPSGQRGWYMYWRTGGDSLVDGAFRMLNVT